MQDVEGNQLLCVLLFLSNFDILHITINSGIQDVKIGKKKNSKVRLNSPTRMLKVPPYSDVDSEC